MNSKEVIAVPVRPALRNFFSMAKTKTKIKIKMLGVFGAAVGMTVVLFALSSQLLAQTETVLYRFCSQRYCADGTTPAATLSLDGQGNLYGAAAGGNSKFYAGVVFQVSASGAESLVYDFSAINQGVAPNGALARDANGDFYGTTAGGGNDKGKCKKYYGCGLVYKLSGGVEQVLYAFKGASDGLEPNGGPVLDASGNIYGTTYRSVGGKGLGSGIVFKVSPDGNETVLHQFGSSRGDGKKPTSGLLIDAKGNLYGTASEGGVKGQYGPGLNCTDGCGVVYEISAAGQEKILYAFKGSQSGDGAAPFASLILDKQGNLYGTTYAGGKYGFGTIFKLTPGGQETVLYNFSGIPNAGNPVGRLLMDAQGNLFGSTSYGGRFDSGTVFELSASGKESVLYSFTGGADGAYPFDGLVMDGAGDLFGTTELGGNFGASCPLGCGVVFKVGK
jgi:uncharacterized repeat protein (TIGR03803 family)